MERMSDERATRETDARADARWALAEEKRALRERMRRLRAGIPAEEREARGRAVASAALALPEAVTARTVLTFLSFGAELPTGPLVEAILAAGKRLVVPFLVGGHMEAAPYRPGDAVLDSSYGAHEPASRAPLDPTEVDLVLAPGLAFDRDGNRLGYGGGYFDAYLRRLRPAAARAAVAFHEQVLARVPAGPADERVQVIVTDREIVRCG